MNKTLRMLEAELKKANREYNELVKVPTLGMTMPEFMMHLQARKEASGRCWKLEAQVRREAIFEVEAE
jgi:hypothetical protein